MLQVILHNGQLQVAQDKHRFRIVCAGRRWGKSVLSELTILKWATENVGLYWIVAPSYRQSKQIHWNQLQQIVPRDWVIKKNEVELSLTLKNGSVIALKGSENPDSLRGVKLRGLVIDEIASIRNWEWLWANVLRPTLTDYEAPALFISTPQGFNHFYDLFNLGQEKSEANHYISWRFTSYDNPYIPKAEIDNAKTELASDTFSQEYLADFKTAVGLAHKPWNRLIHLIEPFEVPKTWERARGFDFGSDDPTASVRVAINPNGDMFIERCYKMRNLTMSDHATAIKAQDYGFDFIPAWGDPSGTQWLKDMEFHKVYIMPASKEMNQQYRGWVENCVERVNELLKPLPGHRVVTPAGTYENAPRLFVLKTPENMEIVNEFEKLEWKKTNTGQVLPMLEDSGDQNGHFDLLAALRYLAVSYKKMAKNTGGLPYDSIARVWGVSSMEAYR